MTTTPDQMCTCGHGAASAHDTDSSIPAFTACVVTGCTCKAFTQAPEPALRQARRSASGRRIDRAMAAGVLARLDRGKQPAPDDVDLLRAVLGAEQGEADQAREQLAAAQAGDAPWIRAYGEDIAAARQGEAEAVRAREAAEQRAEAMTRAMEDTAADALKHRGCHRALMAQCLRAERSDAEARRNRDAWRNARRRAALMTAEVTRRAPLTGEYAARAIEAVVPMFTITPEG